MKSGLSYSGRGHFNNKHESRGKPRSSSLLSRVPIAPQDYV